ncbi:MAG TPA: alpha/beta fold hydrolase [Ktedonobacteraceae bacterium]|nr:alpha/beta fold hydrolase [Ktedonobacteraceae bacterium]
MQKTVGRLVAALIRLLGFSMLATAIVAAVVALRHVLDTPQQLESELPGEDRMYRWRQEHIFYKALGAANAPPLLLLHTLEVGASAYEMRRIMALLAPYYRVYAPDLLGFGLSDHPRLAYSPETYIALCRDFLIDIVGQPATIVASGVSCNFAVTIAATSPSLCERLVLISPVALFGDEQMPALIANLIDAPAVKLLAYSLLSTRPVLRYLRGRQHAFTRDAGLDHYYAAAHQLGAEHAPMALLAGRLAYNASGQLEKLTQPTLIIWGVSALNGSRYIAGPQGRSGHVQVELLHDAGLAVHEELPDPVATAILRWSQQGQQQEAISDSAPVPAQEQAEKSSLAETQKVEPDEQEEQFVEVPAAPSTVEESQPSSEPGPAESAEQEETGDLLPQDQEPESEPEQETDEQAQADSLVVEAYCVKCKQKRTVQDAHEVTMKNGRTAIRGKCPVCGTGLFRIGKTA